MNADALRRGLYDAVWPLLAWLAVAALARALGFASPLYLRVSAALAVLVLPGWWLSRWLLVPGDGLALRLFLAHGLAATWLGLSVAVCMVLGLGFGGWYALHLLACGAALLASARAAAPDHTAELLAARARPWSLVVCAAATVLLAGYFRAPTNVDLEVMAPQSIEHQRRHDFAWVEPGGAAFGDPPVMPRLRAHLVHVSLALLADAVGTNPVAIGTYAATVHLGLLLFLALWAWTRVLAGPAAPPWAAALAPLLPLTVLYLPGAGYQAYAFHHQLLNGPAIDKSCALLFVYPWLLVLAVRWLETGRRAELATLFLSLPLVGLVHPLTAHYAFLGALGLALALGPPARRVGLALGAAAVVAAIGAWQGGGGGEAWVDALVLRDLATRAWPHYWPGHYARWGLPTETIAWVGGRMFLRPGLYLTPLALASAGSLALVAWWRRRAPQADPDRAAGERRALRVVAGQLVLLPAVWLGANLLLQLAPHLWRGVERLHWFFLGFPACALLMARVARWLEARAGARLRPWPALVITGYLLGQLPWLLRDAREFMRRDPGASAAPLPWLLELAHGYPRTAAAPFAWQRTEEAGVGERLWDPPDWLREDDRVYLQTGSDWAEAPRGLGWQLCVDRFALLAHLIHYPELGHEAQAYARQGEPFLAGWDAFHDGLDGRVTGRLLAWLHRERVTVVVSPDPGFVARLARGLGRRARPIDPDTWRLER